MFIEEYACTDLREFSPLLTDEMHQHGQMIGHVQPSPSLSERSVTSYASWACWTHATTELFSTFVEVYIRCKIAEKRMNAMILFWVAPVEALWVAVWEQTLYSTSLSTGVWLPLPTPPLHTCRGVQPSRGVPRGCLPGLDFVSLSADVFLCLCSRSPCPQSPRQCPRPRPHLRPQRHWPALTLSGKLSPAHLASPLSWPTVPAWGTKKKNIVQSCCVRILTTVFFCW